MDEDDDFKLPEEITCARHERFKRFISIMIDENVKKYYLETYELFLYIEILFYSCDTLVRDLRISHRIRNQLKIDKPKARSISSVFISQLHVFIYQNRTVDTITQQSENNFNEELLRIKKIDHTSKLNLLDLHLSFKGYSDKDKQITRSLLYYLIEIEYYLQCLICYLKLFPSKINIVKRLMVHKDWTHMSNRGTLERIRLQLTYLFHI